MKPDKAYRKLTHRFRKLAAIEGGNAMLVWDMMAMMPAGGHAVRAEQVATLEVVAHDLLTSRKTSDLLDIAETGVEGLDDWKRANLREMRRRWRQATALKADLVDHLSRARSACEQVWREARAKDDYAMALPPLRDLMSLVREAGAAKADALGSSVYDALLDEHEPGLTMEKVEPIFDAYAVFLPDFLENVLARQSSTGGPETPPGPFPIDVQRRTARELMRTVGFDFDNGRLDESLHPFCGGVPDDVRLTTRYSEDDFLSALMGVLHETGHAMYERNLPADWRGQPVGCSLGMAVHESQSLLIEMQASRSLAFMRYLAPLLAERFGESGPAWTAENLHKLYTKVERGAIRVDADEVTYPAHIVLRTRLERAMLADELPLEDLPRAWNDGLRELLGVAPENDREGCLQDIHWFDGAYGYFPTYTLGAMTAAQLYSAAKAASPDIEDGLARGDFSPLMGWLRENVHAKGRLLTADQLLTEATGKSLDPRIFMDHLKARYLN